MTGILRNSCLQIEEMSEEMEWKEENRRALVC